MDDHPNDAELLRELGFCFRKKGPAFYPQAETHMLAALKLNDADGELHGMYGGLLKRRRAYEEARSHYMRAYELDPGLYPTVNLGAIAAALQDLEEAKKWYEMVESMCNQAILNNRADYWTYLCLAEALVAKDSGEKAGNALADALRAGAPPEDLASETEQLKFFESIGFFASAARDALSSLAVARS
jgi:Flp pilus assembly protein TadD